MLKKMIYIVDDDMVYQYAARKTMEKIIDSEYIQVFSDGEEALNHILDHLNKESILPDLIFLDLNMPIMDGWEFLEKFKEIKTQLHKIPEIYVVSSSNDDTDTKRASKIAEVTDYIVKPLYSDQFAKIINQ